VSVALSTPEVYGTAGYPPAMILRSRPYASLDDLREMQSLVSRAWRSDPRPILPCTIGDLAWGICLAGPDVDLSERVRIWSDGDETIAWAWITPPSSLDMFVWPELPAADDARIRDEMVDWVVEAYAPAHQAAAAASQAEPSAARPWRPGEGLESWAIDGSRAAAYLISGGFGPTTTELTQFHQPLDGSSPAPELPAGYSLRSMTGPADIPARVEVHRAAFAPSQMTVAKYELLVGLDDYAWDRDLVVVAPDGSFAAFTMCWIDSAAQVGEFEPVGTHPDHQRLGLGKAVNLAGLARLRDVGAREAVVASYRANAASEALYRSVGFSEIAIHRKYTRPAG
jgi:ribosomal protein S18 acetylase RimI-like enzyme